MPIPRIDLTGQKFGRLTVVGPDDTPYWFCVCDCRKKVRVQRSNLKSLATRSCGCLGAELSSDRNSTHGATKTKEYKAWINMWYRCTDSNYVQYDKYKSRKPPKEWKDFEVFFKEVGFAPGPEYSLDRIRNQEPYGPGNVKWSTAKEQANNRG